MKRGEIWWARFPEPVGTRPVVLVSRDEAYTVRQAVAVVEVTSTIRGLATEVKLGKRDGLPESCVANTDGLHTVQKARLTTRIGALTGERLSRLDDALRFSLALE